MSSKITTELFGPAPVMTDDGFLGGRLRLLQSKKGHRAGSEAVFLAAATPARPGQSILDAGAGNGAAGLCLLTRVPRLSLTSVDIDPAASDLAKQNAARNGLGAQVEVVVADIAAETAGWPPALRLRGYQQLICNPPFYAAGAVRQPDAGRRLAYEMETGGLDRWVAFLAAMASPGARLTLIHRAEDLPGLLRALDRRFGAIVVFPLFPRAGEAATRVIVAAEEGKRAPLRILQGLVLHGPDSRYTPEAEAVLRHGAALDLGVM